MNEPTKIDFHHRRVRDLGDVTDLVAMLFPGNRNQQHAAARILLALKTEDDLLGSLAFLEEQHGISRRTLQRGRAKLSRLGLIERVSWMNARYGGREGWKLSSRMSSSLRRLADWVDRWRDISDASQVEKEDMLAGLLKP
mgnify:CR=1 FL=1